MMASKCHQGPSKENWCRSVLTIRLVDLPSLLSKVMGVKNFTFCYPHGRWKIDKKQIFDNLDEVAKLCKSPNDAYNLGGSQFSKYFLIKRVAKGKAFDPVTLKLRLKTAVVVAICWWPAGVENPLRQPTHWTESWFYNSKCCLYICLIKIDFLSRNF